MIRINLLPPEVRGGQDESHGGIWVFAGLGAAAALLLVLGFAYSLQSHTMSELRDETANLEALAAKYKPLIERVNALTRERRELEAKIAVIAQLDEERDFRVRLLEDLNRNMPQYAWLTKFTESGGSTAEIMGKTFSNLVVSDFMTGLERSKLYDVVDLSVAKRGEVGEREVVEFKLTAALTKAPQVTDADAVMAEPAVEKY